MIIEINGAGFVNKGAQLMLETVMHELGSEGISFAMPGRGSVFEERGRRGIRLLAAEHRAVFGPRGLVRAMTRPISQALLTPQFCQAAGLVLESQIDALVDVSGYAFGDHWGARPALNLSAHVRRLRRLKRPVILLPQMFGPFEKPTVAKACRKLVDQVDRVFAREQASYDAICSIAGWTDHISIAPDITIAHGIEALASNHTPLADRDYVCIVPNMRVLDKGGATWEGRYGQLLTKAVTDARDAGLRVILVSHDASSTDMQLVHSLADRIGSERIESHVVKEPLSFKKLAGGARFVLASRFHAAVSALSVGTPALTLGWAHKYRMLVQDFGVGEFDLPNDAGDDQLTSRLDKLLDDAQWQDVHLRLTAAGGELASQSKAMWNEVRDRIGIGS